jgi:hypothetical protein
MARLAEYMTDLATILGEPEGVHFLRIEPGSAVLVQKIDDVAVPKVRAQLIEVKQGNAAPDAMRAYRRTNIRLKQDNCIGLLGNDENPAVIRFPGREEEDLISFKAFNQSGTIDGKINVIGGRGDPVPVHVQQGDKTFTCQASREVAKTFGPYLFTHELRVRGTGRWRRTEEGNWEMQRFTITSFEVLDETPLGSVVAKLRDVPGSGWEEISDPWGELAMLRDEPDEVN